MFSTCLGNCGVYAADPRLKGGMKTIAGRFDDPAVVFFDGLLDDLIVLRQGALHRLRELFPEFCAVLDIGKKKGDRTGRKVGCHFAPIRTPLTVARVPYLHSQVNSQLHSTANYTVLRSISI